MQLGRCCQLVLECSERASWERRSWGQRVYLRPGFLGCRQLEFQQQGFLECQQLGCLRQVCSRQV